MDKKWITKPLPPRDIGRGRSLNRRATRDIDKLVLQLVALNEADVAALPVSAELRQQIGVARGIRAHGGRRRQLRYISGMLRASDGELAAIRAFLAGDGQVAFDPDAELRHLQDLRTGLCDPERYEETLEQACTELPYLDRMEVKRLAQAVHDDGDDEKSYRELFRQLRMAVDEARAQEPG